MHIPHADDLPFRFRNLGDRCYEVSLFGVVLGEVYYEPEAWSYGRWFIAGGRRDRTTGGYSFGPARSDRHTAPRKLHGHERRDHAAQLLAVMQSSLLVAASLHAENAS